VRWLSSNAWAGKARPGVNGLACRSALAGCAVAVMTVMVAGCSDPASGPLGPESKMGTTMASVCSLSPDAIGVELGTAWLGNWDPVQDIVLDSISIDTSQNMVLVGQYAVPSRTHVDGMTGFEIPRTGILSATDIVTTFPTIIDLAGMTLHPGDGAMIVPVLAPKTPGYATVDGYDVHYHLGLRTYVTHVPDGLTYDDSTPTCRG